MELQPRREHVPNTRVLLARPQTVSFYDPRLQLFSAAWGERGWFSYSRSIGPNAARNDSCLPRNRNHAQIRSNNNIIDLVAGCIYRRIAAVSYVLHSILSYQPLESRGARQNMDASSRILDVLRKDAIVRYPTLQPASFDGLLAVGANNDS